MCICNLFLKIKKWISQVCFGMFCSYLFICLLVCLNTKSFEDLHSVALAPSYPKACHSPAGLHSNPRTRGSSFIAQRYNVSEKTCNDWPLVLKHHPSPPHTHAPYNKNDSTRCLWTKNGCSGDSKSHWKSVFSPHADGVSFWIVEKTQKKYTILTVKKGFISCLLKALWMIDLDYWALSVYWSVRLLYQ